MKRMVFLFLVLCVSSSCAHRQVKPIDKRVDFLSWGKPCHFLYGVGYQDGGSIELKFQYGNDQFLYVFSCYSLGSKDQGKLFIAFDKQRYTKGFVVPRNSDIYKKIFRDSQALYNTVDKQLMSETEILDRKWWAQMGHEHGVGSYPGFSVLRRFTGIASNNAIKTDQ